MERNVMGELNVYRGSGAKPNFSEIARRHGMDRHAVAKYWREGESAADGRSARGSAFDPLEGVIRSKAQLPGMTKMAVYAFLREGRGEGLPGYNAAPDVREPHGDRGAVVPAARVLRGLGRRGLRRARGQAGPDRGEAPRARAARQGDSGRDSREARSQEGVTSGLAATDLRTLLHHVCARDRFRTADVPYAARFSGLEPVLLSIYHGWDRPCAKSGKYEYGH